MLVFENEMITGESRKRIWTYMFQFIQDLYSTTRAGFIGNDKNGVLYGFTFTIATFSVQVANFLF